MKDRVTILFIVRFLFRKSCSSIVAIHFRSFFIHLCLSLFSLVWKSSLGWVILNYTTHTYRYVSLKPYECLSFIYHAHIYLPPSGQIYLKGVWGFLAPITVGLT